MNDDVYWSELGLALRPMIGAATVLAGFGAAALTLAGLSSPVQAMNRMSSPTPVCHVCQPAAAHQHQVLPPAPAGRLVSQ